MLSDFKDKEYIDRKGKKLITLDYDKFRSEFTKRI